MVVDVHAVEPVRGNRRMDDRGICVSAETDPAYLACSPVLFEHFQQAPFSQNPIEPLHGVNAMHRENVEVVHLRIATIDQRMCGSHTTPDASRQGKLPLSWPITRAKLTVRVAFREIRTGLRQDMSHTKGKRREGCGVHCDCCHRHLHDGQARLQGAVCSAPERKTQQHLH